MSILDDLAALQLQDGIVRDLEQQVQDAPRRKAHEQNRVKAESDALTVAHDMVMAVKKDIQMAELDIVFCKETLNRLKTQQTQLKTNQEYAAMAKEIKRSEDELGRLTATLERHTTRLEPAERDEREHREKFDVTKVGMDGYLQELDAALAEAQQSLEVERAKREELRKLLDVPGLAKHYLMTYERLSKNRWPALAKLGGDNICGGCHMTLAASKVQDIRRGATVVMCDFCGRLVY